MADYPLSITGAEIDSALGKVHSADTTPTNGSTDMVTSGGVYTAINNLSLANLAGSALVTESEGIAGNDNDTTIPTSAAVKDFVDTTVAALETTPFNRLRIKLPPTSFISKADIRLYGNGAMIEQEGSVYGSGNYGYYASCDIPQGYKAVSATVYGDDTTFAAYSGTLAGGTSTTFLGSGTSTSPSSPATVTFTVVGNSINYVTIGIKSGGGTGRFYGCYVTLQKV